MDIARATSGFRLAKSLVVSVVCIVQIVPAQNVAARSFESMLRYAIDVTIIHWLKFILTSHRLAPPPVTHDRRIYLPCAARHSPGHSTSKLVQGIVARSYW